MKPDDKVDWTETGFTNNGLRLDAWLAMPKEVQKPPVVIMAHGFSGEKPIKLPEFAEYFTNLGMAAFIFDYRFFGPSEGEPRRLINPGKQLSDWEAAIRHVRTREDVDGSRIALWGTSFSGGHVLVTAARVKGIRAVVSQVPFVDGISSTFMAGWKTIFKGASAGMRDLIQGYLTGKPHYVPVVAKPGNFGLLNSQDAYEGYYSLIPEDYTFENSCPARIGLMIGTYRPIRYASRISCPVLMVVAEKDSLISPSAARKTALKIPGAEFVSLDCGHFEVYTGTLFQKVAAMEGEFLKKHLDAQAQ